LIIGVVVANSYGNRYKGLISSYFNQPTQKVVAGEKGSTDYFKSDFKSDDERQTYFDELGSQINEEGSVLLKNVDNALPLKKNGKISLLGQTSAAPCYGGGGSGAIMEENVTNFKKGLEAAGFSINPTLYDFYDKGPGKEYRRTAPELMGGGEFQINEVPQSAYTSEVKDSFKDYADAGVVFIGRLGGEGPDLNINKVNGGGWYLQLDQNEKDLIKMATDSFENVIVVLNTSNPLELAFLEEAGIDACLWVGAIGETGSIGVGKLLSGDANPSGALVDTYAYDSFSSPAMQNLGDYTITNGVDPFAGSKYMTYAEGIYVGYRYYLTRYEDVVLGNEDKANYDYSKVVQFPFGYGLSYTEFEQSEFSVNENGDNYDVSVTVKNTGDVEGRDIVQVYMQSPYTDYDKENKIEKASVELVGFGKTKSLKPGDTETITVSVAKEDFKTFDAYGEGTYILDAGDYYLAAGNDSHEALNNILAAKEKTKADGMDADGDASFTHKINIASQDNSTYAVSLETGNEIGVEFKSADLLEYDKDFKYLTRSDWKGTFPETYSNGKWTAPEDFIKTLGNDIVTDESLSMPETGITSEEYGKLNVAMLREEPYDSELWDALIAQMSTSELSKLVRVGGYQTSAIKSIGLPATSDKDGPMGITAGLTGGIAGAGYPVTILISSSWDKDLAKKFGDAIGEESITLKVAGWYAPATNIHRTPYSGRNFEYFSEDPVLSGDITTQVVLGAQAKGMMVHVKHFAANDQETNRIGGVTFSNEQALREIAFRPYEIAVRESKPLAMMAGFNRLGSTWCGATKGLMTATLRDEWGFEGRVITDMAAFDMFVGYENLRTGLQAGTDLWLNTDESLYKLTDKEMTPTVVTNMQKAAKNIAYAVSKSNAMNGIGTDSKIVSVMPLWQTLLIALSVILVLVALVIAFFTTRGLMRKKG
jgi:beta-glucosidase